MSKIAPRKEMTVRMLLIVVCPLGPKVLIEYPASLPPATMLLATSILSDKALHHKQLSDCSYLFEDVIRVHKAAHCAERAAISRVGARVAVVPVLMAAAIVGPVAGLFDSPQAFYSVRQGNALHQHHKHLSDCSHLFEDHCKRLGLRVTLGVVAVPL